MASRPSRSSKYCDFKVLAKPMLQQANAKVTKTTLCRKKLQYNINMSCVMRGLFYRSSGTLRKAPSLKTQSLLLVRGPFKACLKDGRQLAC